MVNGILPILLLSVGGCDEYLYFAMDHNELCDAILKMSEETLDRYEMDCTDPEANCIKVACGADSCSMSYLEVNHVPIVEVTPSVVAFAERECKSVAEDADIYVEDCLHEEGVDMTITCLHWH